MKKYVGLGGRGGREKPPAPASPLGASSNPLGKPGTWGEDAQGASGDPPPISSGTWQPPPPPCCCCAGPKWISCTSPAPCTPPAAPQHPALPRPPPRCPPCCSPGCQSSIFGPLPLQFMARSGGTAPPCTPPFLAQLLARPGEGCRVLVLCAPKPQPGTAGRGGPRGNNWWGGLVEVPGVGDH